MDNSPQSEQLEEGEIVDDNDFEDISDNSIDASLGKSLTSSENLRAHSLSSESCTSRKQRKKLVYKKSKHHQRKRHLLFSSDSSEDEEETPPELKIQLKEALKRDEIGPGDIKKDLGSRLKAMTQPNTDTVQDKNDSCPNKDNQQNHNDILDLDKIDDHELENLRMEALKTAVINKCQKRKKKKAQESQESKSEAEIDNNKENQNVESKLDVETLEDDEDILRADLLVDLVQRRKKLEAEQKNNEPHNIVVVQNTVQKNTINNLVNSKALPLNQEAKLPNKAIPQKSNNIVRKIVSNNLLINTNNGVNNNTKKFLPKPVVKPLIINVNGDSDSDDNTTIIQSAGQQITAQKPVNSDLKSISNTVDKFLKEQRQKFEIEAKKKQNLIANQKTLLEKSAVKLLPKSQQLEYQQLLRKLKTAERKQRVKKLQLQQQQQAAKLIQNKPKTIEAEVQVNNKADIEDKTMISSQDCVEEEKRNDIISELTTLKRMLKEIRMQKKGSLQIRSKYQVLTPIMRKITIASNERKKHEQRIKSLTKELKEAKINLSKSHEKFSAYVRELVDKKAQIDLSCVNEEINKKEEALQPLLLTSTPIKEVNAASPVLNESGSVSSIVTNHECEDMDICNSDETDVQIDIVDPNDIDQIFTRRNNAVKGNIPEYVSPLNLNCERYKDVDPLGIMCPYEVNGSCRDLECTFKHYLINH